MQGTRTPAGGCCPTEPDSPRTSSEPADDRPGAGPADRSVVTVWSPFFAREASDAVSAGPTPSRGGTASLLQLWGFGRLGGTGATGLEPATSGVTGRRSNQLSYAPVRGTV